MLGTLLSFMNIVDSHFTMYRCKRHSAIFSAPWPHRIASSEAPSSTSSSSDSSSNETAIEDPHENVKDGAIHGHKLKYSKKYVEVKHSTERPVKRRKTDSILYSKVAYHHTDIQPRNANGKFDSFAKARKFMGYSHNKFTIPGGAQRSRENRAHNRELTKSLVSLTSRILGHPIRDQGDQGIDKGHSRKRPWDESSDFVGSRTIRHLGPLPALPVTKSLAALCARPSPNLFARHAWSTTSLNNNDPADEDSSIEVSSDLTDLTELEQKPVSKSTPESTPTPVPKSDESGQKRKRDSVAVDRRKMGKSFYMKDKKRPMPKGWVLVTDSSEETGEDEEEEAVSAEPPKSEDPLSGITKPVSHTLTADRTVDSPVSGLDSVSGSTPSLVHTPSSRATSTPTQSSGTLVDDQATTPVAAKRVLITYSLRRNATGRTPSTAQSPKRRKLSDEVDTTPSRDRSRHVFVDPISQTSPESYDPSYDQDANTSLKLDMSINDSSPDSSTPPAENESSGEHVADRYFSTEREVSLFRSSPILVPL